MKKTVSNSNSTLSTRPPKPRTSSMSSSTTNHKTKPVYSNKDVNSIFKRTEVIGRGKFGVVYKGYNMKTKQIYAIKVLNLDSDSDEVEDVQREVQFLSSLTQMPNITRYYGSYLQNTSLWIIMEYCAGGSLRSLLRPGKIEEKYLGVIMRELLIALSFIHKDNIIHRDIKAANVLICNDGSVKLCDFGVAAQLNQMSNRRQTIAGTPYWMAPEVIMEGVSYDTKADIWSVGITAYEVATGNPPYCDVEALRVMQLITKSKPARLEGKGYSAFLKEFIALCLDEEPTERPSADELLKSKFIKAHKATPTSILKELITRYLLFRDKTKRESVNFAVGMDGNKVENGIYDERRISMSGLDDEDDEHIDMKWDFDSLSSADYIVENNINIDNISTDPNDWSSEQQENFNYAYPDEDQYLYYQTNSNANKTFFHGTTMGKGMPGTVYHNSTLNAMSFHHNGTTNIQSKPFIGTSTHVNTKSTATGTNSARNVDSNAPKQLLELFEENDIINEAEEDADTELARVTQNTSANHMGALKEESMTPLSDTRPHVNMLNSNSYFGQSTASLPVLQTKFSNISKGPASAITSVPTSIEIEIPEELPTSAAPSTSNTTDANSLNSKPRSSTVSASPLSYKKPHGISRRLTVGGESNGSDDSRNNSNAINSISNGATTIEEEIKKSSNSNNVDTSLHTKSDSNNSGNSNTLTELRENSSALGSVSFKSARNTPSPSKILLSNSISPNRKPALSPTNAFGGSVSNLGIPPTMKPMITKPDSKNILLHPLNTGMSNTSINGTNNSATPNPTISTNNSETGIVNNDDKNGIRNNNEFKRNNFNLKLQMPLPTTMMRNKLLDTNSNNANSSNTAGNISTGPMSATNENINQFGFNTSTTNVPVSMTPISEKHMDFGSKIKRSLSITNRKNSSSSSDSNTNINNLPDGHNSNIYTNQDNGKDNDDTVDNNSTELVDSNKNKKTIINNNITLGLSASNLSLVNTVPSNININGSNNPNHGHSTSGSHAHINSGNDVMRAPPAALSMSMFHDTEFTDGVYGNDRRRIDRKPQVLQELQELLTMFEEGLPVVENTLKKMLADSNPSATTGSNTITSPNNTTDLRSTSITSQLLTTAIESADEHGTSNHH